MDKNKLIEIKKRLLCLAMTAVISTTFVSCKNSSDKNYSSESHYNIESFGDADYSNDDVATKQSEFTYYFYPNGYYFARNRSKGAGYPIEQWHAVKTTDYKKSDYDFIIQASTISNVVKITNDDGSITYKVPKGFELRVFDGILFGMPEKENIIYEILNDQIEIGVLDDGTKTYTIPNGYNLKEAELENEYVYYQLVESNVRKRIKD